MPAAVANFDVDLRRLHWDITSIVLQSGCPPEEGVSDCPHPAYGFGGERYALQLCVGELPTADGAVPLLQSLQDGNADDVGSILPSMEQMSSSLTLPECRQVGDIKLSSAATIGKLHPQKSDSRSPVP